MTKSQRAMAAGPEAVRVRSRGHVFWVGRASAAPCPNRNGDGEGRARKEVGSEYLR
jgi:hypothetical protein